MKAAGGATNMSVLWTLGWADSQLKCFEFGRLVPLETFWMKGTGEMGDCAVMVATNLWTACFSRKVSEDQGTAR
jgi:hypothetical protein